MKHLIVSGCSFTFESWNWPTPVANAFNMKLYNVGMGSMGNRLIARRLVAQTQKLLDKGINPSDIICGVMWSGISRYDRYTHTGKIITSDKYTVENPTHITNDKEKSWEILNQHWDSENSFNFYRYNYTDQDLALDTVYHILFVQNYLNLKGIKYFMSTYMDIFKEIISKKNTDINFFYNMIDFSKFLSIKGCMEWCKDQNNSNYINLGPQHDHPFSEGHEAFANQVVIPFLIDVYSLKPFNII